jgi:hypothetical protein
MVNECSHWIVYAIRFQRLLAGSIGVLSFLEAELWTQIDPKEGSVGRFRA